MNISHRHLLGCTVVLSLLFLSAPTTGHSQDGEKEITTSVMLKVLTPKGHWSQSPSTKAK